MLGTFCAIDHAPRVLTDAQRETLELLAAQVMALLELRRRGRMLAQERAALQSHRRFFALSLDLLCTADERLHFQELNPAWVRTLGFSLEELRSRPFTDLVHPDDLAVTIAEATKLGSQGYDTVHFENRYRHKRGHWVSLSWTAVLADGTYFATARDISAYKEKEAALLARDSELAQSEGRMRALFDGMVEGVVLQEATGAIVSCNPAPEEILGPSREQMMGRTSIDPRWRSIREDGSDFPGDAHPAMESLRTGESLTNVVMGVKKPSGALTWISINARPLLQSDGPKANAVITTFRDISEQKAAAAFATRLARQERLITTGTLAAGVGHGWLPPTRPRDVPRRGAERAHREAVQHPEHPRHRQALRRHRPGKLRGQLAMLGWVVDAQSAGRRSRQRRQTSAPL